ncbi:zinc-binding dehydrogenase [Veronia pacifica]|uniref:Enoyl reductase (ER) domain-containing protein n=1 Tax=Veronia pacifica TaxID=1080227 RepID=A0A1C3EB87_9GAMM|nr:zinc-binding dehydrogenase [Veronia pacifica]ODA30460.1 hypothetical protein A8L45_20195 [Veronia pacifica]
MKAWQLVSPDGLDSLQLGDTSEPTMSDNDVIVDIHAIALNHFDYKLASWGYATWEYPQTIGTDLSGVVIACGKNVSRFSPGDKVCAFADPRTSGAFAEQIAVEQHCLARVPDNVTHAAAAAIANVGLTACHTLLNKLKLNSGDALIINGAAGGVGAVATQLAKMNRLRVIAIDAGKHRQKLLSLGADCVLDYQHDNIAMEVMHETQGAMADALIDCVASKKAGAYASLLRYDGQLASVSESLGEVPVIAAMRGLTIHEISLSGVYAHGLREHREILIDNFHTLLNHISSGKLDPGITEYIAFEQLKDGLEKIRQGQSTGKIVVTVR